jgi:hypothetical protein
MRRYADARVARITAHRLPRRSTDRRDWIIRPDDLLVLGVEPVNLKVVAGEDGAPAQLVADGDGAPSLIVTFPPQSIAEEAYYTTQAEFPPDGDEPTVSEPVGVIPIPARIAGWSRLAFVVPPDQLPIEWTLPGILRAIGELRLSVAPNALPPREPRGKPLIDLVRPPLTWIDRLSATAGEAEPSVPVAPSRLRSASLVGIARERRAIRTVGYRLGLSNLSGSATASLVADVSRFEPFLPHFLLKPEPRPPARHETALELPWRLILSPNEHATWDHRIDPMTSDATGHTELWHTRLDGPDEMRTVRAIWSTGEAPPTTPAIGEPVDVPDAPDPPLPFLTSLNIEDRHSIVHSSSNFRLRETNHGGPYEPAAIDVDTLALSSLGAWVDLRGVWDEPRADGLALEEWRHRATLGRDHYVRVVYAGRLYPLGHRAVVVTVSERRFEGARPGNPAYLRQMTFVIVREPMRTYRSSGWRGAGNVSWDLQLPFSAARITTRTSPLLDNPAATKVGSGSPRASFWPYVGGQPFRFHVVATDTTGQVVELEMPLIFVRDDVTVAENENDAVQKAYRERAWPNSPKLLAEVDVGGQRLAFAHSPNADETSFAVRSLTFGAGVKAGASRPNWVPLLKQAALDVPAFQSIAGTTAPATLSYATPYLVSEFGPGNAGEVFLEAVTGATPLDVAFSARSDRSGGFLAPDMRLNGLSRIAGPVAGPINLVASGNFDPIGYFGALATAKVFGVIPLKEVIAGAGFDQLDRIPRFVGETLDEIGRLITQLERLHRLLQADPVAATAGVRATVDALVDPGTGAIHGLLTGGDVGAVIGQLAVLEGQLDGLPEAMAAGGIGAGPVAVARGAIGSLQAAMSSVDLGKLTAFAGGAELPEAFSGRFEWRPKLNDWPPPSSPLYSPDEDPIFAAEKKEMVVSVEAAGREMVVTCALDAFVLNLRVLVLRFDRLQFRAHGGKKPEIDVAFTDFEFTGPLSFIETLRSLIPLDGFSDPPEVTVSSEGITAGFSAGLPNIAVGVFSLENLSLAAGFSVPFVDEPMSTWFRFCERENPARLTVGLFGGGFFFGIVVDAKDLQVAEGAFEFGAAASVDFGVASGSVSCMAGIYFKIESDDLTLAGYFRMRGEVEALSIISVCIELYLEMLYESGSGKCVGTATLTIEVEVAMFSASVEITATKKFAGSGADPTLREMLDVTDDVTSEDWNRYCAAFAA